jgi:hypothetical protein
MIQHTQEPRWLEWAKQIQAISQTGLTNTAAQIKMMFEFLRYPDKPVIVD